MSGISLLGSAPMARDEVRRPALAVNTQIPQLSEVKKRAGQNV
jgi:hypothetical protein